MLQYPTTVRTFAHHEPTFISVGGGLGGQIYSDQERRESRQVSAE